MKRNKTNMKRNKTNIPDGAKKVNATQGRHIIASGEVTGHHHAIEATEDAELYQLGDELLLAVEKPAPLTHEEHKPITIDPGLYEIGGVVEFDHLQQMERKVVD